MVVTQSRPKRKSSGARYKDYRGKKKYEMGRLPSQTRLDGKKLSKIRTRGANRKLRLLAVDVANVYNPKTKKYQKVKINNILENPANGHFMRRNIITKGGVIETEIGKAKITSRPGQDGAVNAVLIS